MKWMDGFSWVDSEGWTGRSSTQTELMRNAQNAQMMHAQHLLQQQARQQMYGVQASPVETLGSGEVKDRYEITDHTPEAVEVMVIEKPIPSRLTEIKTDLKEYAELAALVGINPAELTIETFKAFLHEHDIPVFNLKEVVTYMDDKAKRESKDQAGWEWRPLRKKDHREGTTFGRKAEWWSSSVLKPASDWYNFPGNSYRDSNVYDKLVPLHALKKVALIEKHFGDKVGMFVCDYAPIPAIPHPDPFLMAVITNPRVKEGEGRFILDFWAEPGFGLTSQLK